MKESRSSLGACTAMLLSLVAFGVTFMVPICQATLLEVPASSSSPRGPSRPLSSYTQYQLPFRAPQCHCLQDFQMSRFSTDRKFALISSSQDTVLKVRMDLSVTSEEMTHQMLINYDGAYGSVWFTACDPFTKFEDGADFEICQAGFHDRKLVYDPYHRIFAVTAPQKHHVALVASIFLVKPADVTSNLGVMDQLGLFLRGLETRISGGDKFPEEDSNRLLSATNGISDRGGWPDEEPAVSDYSYGPTLNPKTLVERFYRYLGKAMHLEEDQRVPQEIDQKWRPSQDTAGPSGRLGPISPHSDEGDTVEHLNSDPLVMLTVKAHHPLVFGRETRGDDEPAVGVMDGTYGLMEDADQFLSVDRIRGPALQANVRMVRLQKPTDWIGTQSTHLRMFMFPSLV